MKLKVNDIVILKNCKHKWLNNNLAKVIEIIDEDNIIVKSSKISINSHIGSNQYDSIKN